MKMKAGPGSATGRPIMKLLDLVGRRWVLRILWELRAEQLTFRSLRERCDDISPTVLNARLKDLRDHNLVHRTDNGYGLTVSGQELALKLSALSAWAKLWAATLPTAGPDALPDQ